MMIKIVFITVFLIQMAHAQSVANFEAYNLSEGEYINGADGSGGFRNGDIFLPNEYNSDFMAWSGWAISAVTDVTTPGFTNQYSAIPGGGYNGSGHYAVTYAFGNNNIKLTGEAAGKTMPGMYITNNTYSYYSMKDGDAFSKKFGGITGNDADYFLLTIKAYHNGLISNDSIDFYLADYRFLDNTKDYIVDTWEWVDISELGSVDSLTFRLSSSDTGIFGMNTPAYFCTDNVFDSNPSSIEENVLSAEFVLKPNPANEYVNVHFYSDGMHQLDLLDLTGNILRSIISFEEKVQLDLQSLHSGMYIIRTASKERTSSKIFTKI